MKKLKVTVSGGGPVGLIFALLLKDLIPSENLLIKVYDGRWSKSKNNSIVSWKSITEGTARRQQVVTLQSQQYLQLPQTIQEQIFLEGCYSEMWPITNNFDGHHRPRNVRILHIENVLLDIANQTKGIKLIPENLKITEGNVDIKDQHLLVICEGSNSKTRESFINKFGEPNTSMYSLDGLRPLDDAILGLKVKSNLTDPETVNLTIAQNRFLLNSLNGEGFLNIRLTDEEVKAVKGVTLDDSGEVKIVDCIQSHPCIMERSHDNTYRCRTHSTLFLAPFFRDKNPLWSRIEKALELFQINKEDLEAITLFKLSMAQRPRFTAQLYPPTEKTPGTFGCLLGDAANAIHFWPGRGLNSGIDSAVSLARCIHNKWQNSEEREIKFRDADFLRHEGIMGMLQYRHKSRAWHSMVITDENYGYCCAIKDKIQYAIDESKNPLYDKDANINEFKSRLTKINNRLKGRLLSPLPTENDLNKLIANIDEETLMILIASNPWNTNIMSGEEVDVDLLFPERDPSPLVQRLKPLSDKLLDFRSKRKLRYM